MVEEKWKTYVLLLYTVFKLIPMNRF